MLLALTMLPAAGIQSAFADEPAARPATTGGDVMLEGATDAATSVAAQREDGMYAADGLVYAATDGGLSLVGFDGLVEGDDAVKEITIPEAVLVDGTETPVVAIDIAEGQVANGIVALTLPQSINDVNVATLAAALPNLASVEVAMPKASAPVAAGAAAIRAAYSSFGGVLYRNAWVATDGDASQTTLVKELVWAPPATVVARIPAECTSIAPGAFADVRDLKTVVCFGVMEEIPQTQKADDGTVVPGAFTDEQIATVNVIVPQTGTVVPDGDHVSASVAVTDHSTMDIKRESWWKAGFASDRITLGEVYGSTTNTLPVTDEGALETAEAEVAYAPETTQNSSSRKAGIEPPESAIPTPVPDDDQIDSSESGLVFTHLADMTLSVSWKGDPTITPAHLDIPAYATINGVTYPVTEIAPHAFEGAVFLTSITIPETVKAIGDSAFEGCTNLAEAELPSALKKTATAVSVEASVLPVSFEENGTNHPTPSQGDTNVLTDATSSAEANVDDFVSPYATSNKGLEIYVYPNLADKLSVASSQAVSRTSVSASCYKVSYTGGNNSIYWSALVAPEGTAHFYAKDNGGGDLGWIVLSPPSGWKVASVSGDSQGGSATSSYLDTASLTLVRAEAFGSYPLLTTNSFSGTGSATTVARSDHNHDSTYAKKTDLNNYVTTSALNGRNYITKAVAELDNFYGKSQFNTIGYNGLDNADYAGALPTFYVNDASKLPTVPEPVRDGYKFTGWTWGGSSSPNKDASGAFSAGGPVTLTAHWEEDITKAGYFFTESDPFNSGDSGSQADAIAVRLSGDAGKTLTSISFSDNSGGLLSNPSAIEFKVGVTTDFSSDECRTVTGWGTATASMPLVPLAGGGYGVYVKATLRDGAVDASKVVESYADGSYVASFVKLNYILA